MTTVKSELKRWIKTLVNVQVKNVFIIIYPLSLYNIFLPILQNASCLKDIYF